MFVALPVEIHDQIDVLIDGAIQKVPGYYNEIDPYAAQWLRNLIAAGHIAPGDVDERASLTCAPTISRGYTQCHFFAGIGGWSVALRLAGWPDDRPVWTGSCPCQPFSAAGAGKAADDERHLWPAWFPLIAQCSPAIVFGEQVEAAVGWGWLDAVFADLEGEGYACGATVLPACGVGAPHIRQRCWFVADADGRDASAEWLQRSGQQRQQPQDGQPVSLADTECGTAERRRHDLAGAPGASEREAWERQRLRPDVGASEQPCDLADTNGSRQREGRSGEAGDGRDAPRLEFAGLRAPEFLADPERNGGRADEPQWQTQGRITDGWAGADWIECVDGKARPVEPGTFPLAHGIPGRMGRLRAYAESKSKRPS
jgi:DNA (cytosine-5)-methyltransferase 1